jgi:CHAT domain-containing protein
VRRAKIPLFLFLGGLFVAVWVLVGRGDRSVEVRAFAPEPAQSFDYDEDYSHFVALLSAFRGGADESLAELRSAARALAERYDRSDAPEVVEYFARLTAKERGAGLEAYGRFVEFYRAVRGADPDGWQEERVAILLGLRELVAETLAQPDFTPAGSALSLIAWIETRALRPTRAARSQVFIEEAIREAREAVSIFERAGMLTPKLEPLWLLGQLEELRGRELDAREYFDTCLRLSITARNSRYRERALIGLIALARTEGDVPEMKDLARRLAKITEPEDCWQLALACAALLIHDDEAEGATEFLLRTRPTDRDDLSSWHLLMALSRLRQDDFLGARWQLQQIPPEEYGEDEILAEARLALAEGRTGEVIARFGGGGEVERFSRRGRRFARTLLGEALLESGQPGAALAALRSARRISEGWEARLSGQYSLEAGTASVIGEWQGLHTSALEARALTALGRELEAALAIERAQAEFFLRGAEEPLSIDDLLAWAGSFEHGLVTWVVGAEAGLAVHITADGVATALEIDLSRKELVRAVRRFREALLLGDDESSRRLSVDLCTAILPEELRKELSTASGNGRLLCLAHGPIERLALEALQLDGVVLDERAALLVLPGLPARRPDEPLEAAVPWQLLGDPLDAGGGTRLPAAADELFDVSRLLPDARLSTGDDFTREACLDALRTGAPLHFATHLVDDGSCSGGRFAAVGLELSFEEILCAEKIAATGSRAPLVVLSACATSEGTFVDSRGLQGLACAFLKGGARDLLVTLWPVEDRSARHFTPIFHRALLEGQSPSRAAQTARRALAGDGESAANWAAYRVLGRD